MDNEAFIANLRLDFDLDPLREKYKHERDRRIRTDGNAQYVEVTGKFRHLTDDPYVEPGFTRAPLTDEVNVVVIGGGFGGLLAGARFHEAGIKDVRIVESGGDFGGTLRPLQFLYAEGFPTLDCLFTGSGCELARSRFQSSLGGGRRCEAVVGLADAEV